MTTNNQNLYALICVTCVNLHATLKKGKESGAGSARHLVNLLLPQQHFGQDENMLGLCNSYHWFPKTKALKVKRKAQSWLMGCFLK